MIKLVLQVSCIANLTAYSIMIFLVRKQKEELIKLFVTATQKDMAFNSSMMRCRCPQDVQSHMYIIDAFKYDLNLTPSPAARNCKAQKPKAKAKGKTKSKAAKPAKSAVPPKEEASDEEGEEEEEDEESTPPPPKRKAKAKAKSKVKAAKRARN